LIWSLVVFLAPLLTSGMRIRTIVSLGYLKGKLAIALKGRHKKRVWSEID